METYEPEIPFPETTPIQPVEKSNWPKFILVLLVGIMIGGMLLGMFIFFGGTDAFLTDGQCLEQAANFTTSTGNFTYINNGSIGTRGLRDYCVSLIQTQLNQGGK